MSPTKSAVRDSALGDSLRVVVPVLTQICTDHWCVIGSAAARVIGADVDVADIDVLCTHRDAEALIAHWSAQRDRAYAPAAADRFRSRCARFDAAALPLEVMGDLELCVDGAWQRVQVQHVVEREFDGLRVPIPAMAEQLRLLESFGRPKDHARVALLRQLPSGNSVAGHALMLP